MDESSRTEIESAIAAVREVLESDDPAAIRDATDTLNTAFHRVSEAMYERAAQQAHGAANGSAAGSGDDSTSGEEDVVDAEVVDEPSA